MGCKDENNHHRFKKYHDFPVTETLMAYLPFGYKAEDSGAGPIAIKSFATDFLFGAAIYQGLTAGTNAAPGIASKRAQSGFMLLGLIVAVIAYEKAKFQPKAPPSYPTLTAPSSPRSSTATPLRLTLW